MFKKIIFIVLGILVALLALMAVFKICPPQGPWPMPPWCEGGIQLPKINLPGLPSTPSTEGTHSTKQETKSAPTKAEIVTANVIVTVPYWTTGDVYVGLGNNPKYIKLERVNDVIDTLKLDIFRIVSKTNIDVPGRPIWHRYYYIRRNDF